MKIKWRDVYWPAGEWIDETEHKVAMPPNFYCTANERFLICVAYKTQGVGGHGDPGFTSEQPIFVDIQTLETVKPEGFIEVSPTPVKQVDFKWLGKNEVEATLHQNRHSLQKDLNNLFEEEIQKYFKSTVIPELKQLAESKKAQNEDR